MESDNRSCLLFNDVCIISNIICGEDKIGFIVVSVFENSLFDLLNFLYYSEY